ncbi:MAG: glycoside hydrolase family 88 protein, partial [Planctomycetota bacterium]|nr:glycoside hydrolase family 88 protein [Planctomycetota bacterium]
VSAPDWTSGFYSGCLWLTFEQTGRPAWQTLATAQTLDLSGQQFNTGDHDIGFRIMSSYGHAYRLTGDPVHKTVILNAAQSFATRFNTTVGCTRSWDFGPWQFPVIIDNLMNLELLFWSGQNGGDANHSTMAHAHALRSLQEHVRPDGSTFHVVDFNPTTGQTLWQGTYQGHADFSTWSRGQAWAIYGFTMAYRYTSDPVLLEGAERVANYFLANLPADGVPYWDFQAPSIPNEPRDSSAAAIASSGLLELSHYTTSPSDRIRYRRMASRILRALSSPAYLASGSNSDGILLHGVGNKPANREIDVALIYGDYYFLEALGRW